MNPAENYILNQPEPYRNMLLHLQIIIENTIPEVELLYKYKIPFYYYKKRPFCFLNASHKNNFVDICFVRGNQISIHQDLLVIENRKKMASLRYKSLEQIDDEVLIEVTKNVIPLY